MMRVEPADVTADRAVLSIAGPLTDQALAALGAGPLAAPDVVPVPAAKFATGTVPGRPTARYAAAALPGFDGLVRRVEGGADLLVPRAAVPDVIAAAGLPLAGIWAYEAMRVAARRPRLGFETDHKTLAAEVGWPARPYTWKRDATGVRRRSPGSIISGARRASWCCCTSTASPPTSSRAGHPGRHEDGRAVGFVGTAARHYELGQIALAVVRQNVKPEDGGQLQVGPSTAAIDPL